MLGQEKDGLVPLHLVLAESEVVYYVHCPTPAETKAEALRWIAAFTLLIPTAIKSVIQGELQHSTDRGRTWTPRYVLLLSEELLIFESKEASQSFDPLRSALHRLSFTDEYFTADATSGGGGGTAGDRKSFQDKTHPFAFQVCDLGQNSTSFYLAAPDAQHKMFWMMAISKIIVALLHETVGEWALLWWGAGALCICSVSSHLCHLFFFFCTRRYLPQLFFRRKCHWSKSIGNSSRVRSGTTTCRTTK